MATCPFSNNQPATTNPCTISCALRVGAKCAFTVIAENTLQKKQKNTSQSK